MTLPFPPKLFFPAPPILRCAPCQCIVFLCWFALREMAHTLRETTAFAALAALNLVQSSSSALSSFWRSYDSKTDRTVKMVDVYLVYALATAFFQFAYCFLVGTFPFNSFLAGFGCALGCFILGGTWSLAHGPCAGLARWPRPP